MNRLSRAGLELLPPDERAAALLPFLCQEAARALRLAPARVRPDMPLTAHGLDSLAAIELKAGLDARLEIELPLTDLLEGPSLGQLAEQILASIAGPAAAARAPRIPRFGEAGETPAASGTVSEGRPSIGQRALWLLERLSPDSAANHIVAAARIRSGLDVAALGRAFAGLVERHSALRTTFAEVRGAPVPRVHERLELELLEQDVSPETLDARLAEAAWRPLDLEHGPLLRVVLFSSAADDRERVLLLVIHHIVSDFWSLAVLARDLGRLYAAEVAGRTAVLDPPALDFRHWVAWQEEGLAGAGAERLWSYWLRQLAGELPHLDLPTDRPRPPVQSHRGGSRSLRLPPELAAALRRFSRDRGVTLYVSLLAAFQVLLHRYTGQEDLLVGSPTAGRPVAEVEETVGYFVNPVVLRAAFGAASTLDQVLAEAKRTVLGALAHADLPLALLAERLQPVRDPSRPVLFQVMFVLQQTRHADDEALAAFALGAEGTRLDLGGLVVEPWPFEQRRSQFDLTLVAAEIAGGLGISLRYGADLFDDSTAVRLAGHYANLLAGIAANPCGAGAPAVAIHDLAMLSPAERDQALRGWNDTGEGRFSGLCLHQLFEAQVERTPEATALVCGEIRLTYRELDARAGRLARRLAARGVGPERRVGLFVERSIEMVEGLLGVLKAGGAYVPIDPAYPPERVAFLLQDSRSGEGPAVLLTRERLLARLPELPGETRVVCLDSRPPPPVEEEADLPGLPRPGHRNLAYLIYTSGSTGRPKGVTIEHRSAVALVGWALDLFPAGELAGVLAATSICFDLAVFELFAPLARGGQVVLAGNVLELPLLPARDEVTLVNTVPSAMAELVRLRGLPASVRCVCLAGEPLPRALAEQIHQIPTVERLYNLYGPSEATTYSTGALIARGEVRPPAIGRPITGTRAYVLGRRFELVPAGAPGELYLGGAGLARGYLDRPDLTAGAFLPDPWSEPGARLYRTGDLVRHRAAGELEFLGRMDHQVKVRGFRIELGELEAALAAHPGVAEAVVVVREDRPGDRRLAAYVVPHAALGAEELSAHLRQRLPEFMVPSDFVLLPALPRTANGKLDRKALPAPERAASAERQGAWATPVMELLAGIWTELLGVETPGPEEDFFACGGHSLMAARLVARVRELLGTELPLTAVFEAPTLTRLAARIEGARRESLGLAAPPRLVCVPRTGEIPLSFAQERLWFLDQMQPGGAAYNLPFAAHLDGELEVAAFCRALAEIARRHETLRTTFVTGGDGRVVQEIAPPDRVPPPGVVDLTALPEPAAEARRQLAVEARRPFDLARGPLLRTVLWRLAARSHVALVVLHHIVSDGWSMGVFLRELAALYAASPLPALPVQYADYAAWQRSWLASGVLDSQLAWWRERLAGAPQVLELPMDRPRPPLQGWRGGERVLRLPAGLVQDLQALGRREGATLFMVLLAAFQALLQRYTGQDDFLVGSPVAGRGHRELEPLIGFFVNDLVLRADLSGDPAFPVLLSRLRREALAAYTHQDVPFERLVEELRPERDRSRPPLVQVMFALQNAPLPEPRLGALALTLLEVTTGAAKLDLALSLRETTDGGVAGGIEFNRDLFDAATVERLLDHFAVLLRGIAAAPERRLSDLPLLAGAERQLLAAWNEPAAGPPPETPVHQLVWDWVERTPEALAAAGADGERVTYGELGRRALGLARHLRALGVGPERVVALCLEPGIRGLTGMLGVLAAGGAYLPLDPSHPRERLAFMLAEAGADVVLTEGAFLSRLPPAGWGGLRPPRALALDQPWTWEGTADAPGPVVSEPGPAVSEPGPAVSEPGPAAAADNLAYVIYTSGSTGRPKGVAIPHRGLANLVAWHQRTYEVTVADRATGIAGPAFDAAVWEVWPYLAAGASLHFPDAATRAAPAALLRWLAAEGITLCFLPTPLAEACLAEAPPAGLALRALLTGGDRLRLPPPPGLPFLLVNHYGPTESSVVTTRGVVAPAGDGGGAAGEEAAGNAAGTAGRGAVPTIGRPIANLRVHLLDRWMNRVPVGVPGELHIGGVGLARGYLGSCSLTAESFIPDPFSTQPGARLYRTGDLARRLPAGDLDFLGRRDRQVKVRGFRIELGEIEAALLAHPEVREAAVLALGEDPGDLRLVAYLGTGGGIARSPQELRGWLGDRLPAYMVPAAFLFLPALPLSASGKLDRLALQRLEVPPAGAAPAARAAASGALAMALRTPVEELLAGIWEELLRVERIGVDDDFFAMGGHSLLAARLLARVRRVCAVEIPLQVLFEAPTVRSLAAAVESARRSMAGQLAPPPPVIAPVPRGRELPLSFSQERLWFLDRWEPGSPVYNIAAAVDFTGELDVRVLRRCVSEIVRRHESLRTVFTERGGSPVQEILAPSPVPLPAIDLTGLPEERRRQEVARLALAAARQGFDLARGPLLRMRLLRAGLDSWTAILTLHHIVADGWSMGVFRRELGVLYRAFSGSSPSPLSEPAIQYADYAVWQRAWLAGGVLERQLSSWRERLAGAADGLEVPTDRPRPAVQSLRGGQQPVALPHRLSGEVSAFSRRQGLTPFMTLLAAFQVLLGRLADQDDVLVGSPVANRGQAEIEGSIGVFVNTLVFRGDLAGDPAVAEALVRIRGMCLEAFANQDLPFERLVEELRPHRDLARPPLVQVLLVHQSASAYAREDLEIPGLRLAARPVPTGSSKFDLTLSLAEEPGGSLGGYLEYDAALFDAATASRLSRRFETLLAGALADPSRRLSELPLLAAAERQQLFVEWGDGGPLAGGPACIHQLFAAQVARTPEAAALVHGDRTLTYHELDRRASRLARRLRALGVGPEQRVGICMERSPALVIGLLAILKAGGAYAPIDPGYPRERQAFILKDAQQGMEAPVLLTTAALLQHLPLFSGVSGFTGRILCLREDGEANPALDEDEGEGSPAADVAPDVAPENLAYVIHTSGSTGRPKGVAIEHASAAARIRWAAAAFRREELAAVLASTSICFDLSVFELFVPLSLGGMVVLAADVLELPGLAAAGRLTLVNTVPSAMAELLRAGDLPASLRVVNLAGEPLPRELVERIHQRTARVRVLNLYGPSEDTTYSSFAVIPPGEAGPPAIGRPVAGTRALVADRWLRPVPPGVPGELLLGGAGLARGYLHRPEITAERFVPDPWSAAPGARLYRTGDRVRHRPGGDLEFLGRIDHQVKVRGFRIEPGEIEMALGSHAAVEQAVVLALAHSPAPAGDRRLVAFVVPAGEMPPISELRSHLQARLPEFMLPSAYVPLAALPLTANGKVDRRALAQLALARAASSPTRSGTEPRTPTEELLAGFWAEILQLERVAVEDDFFELGGHSLLAVRVVSRVREALGVELPVRALFEAPRIASLAARIEQERRRSAPPAAPPIVPIPRGGEVPLSFAQERLWFLEQLDPGSPVYNIPFALRLAGGLDVPALHGALAEIVRRHETLRTTFARQPESGRPVRILAAAAPLPLPAIDLTALPAEARGAAAAGLAAAEARRPFDLSRDPPCRFRRVELARSGRGEQPGEQLLLGNLHHAVSDGWSFEVFLRELAALYRAFAAGEGSPLTELPLQYSDYAAWQRAWLATPGILEPQLGYWRERLAGAPAGLELPLDRRRPAVQSLRGAQVELALPEDLMLEVRALSRRQGTTSFMTLMTGFHALLGRITGEDDVLVGTPVANRNRVETEGLIGCFVNLLALRGDLSGEPAFAALLQRAREASLGAYAHQDLPFERLVEELRPRRDLSRPPLFQVMLLHQRAAPGLDLPGLAVHTLPLTNGTSKFELTLALVESGPRLAGVLEYSADLFDRATALRLLGHFGNLLGAAAADPARPFTELPLLSEPERLQLVVAWNETAAVAAEPACIHQLFAAQADRSPDAAALSHGERTLTYRELDRSANRLAHRLRALGVSPEERVGVLLHRTPEMVIALLGILKAGGAYVPIDPAYPRDRQAFLLADAQRGAVSPVLVTERQLLAGVPDFSGRALCLDGDADAGGEQAAADAPPLSGAVPGNLAYLIYTSGSTGRPKGVAIEHASAVALIRWARDVFSAEELAVVLAATSICFDLSVFELFVPLSWGGWVVLAAGALELPVLAARDQVTLINTVPSAIAELVRGGLPASVRTVNLAGEPLERDLADRVYERSAVRRVLNLYGPSEDTTYSTFAEVPRGEVPTIGRPLAGKRAHVLDRRLRLVPVGARGELCLGGAGLARGYLQRPELTAERFVPDPFGPAGSRLYRTGDLARRLPSAALEFLGRMDHQIKVRGFRIELGEIEAALGDHPAVARAVVTCRAPAPGEGAGERTLVAYVMPAGEAAPASELRRHLQSRLPAFMIPGAFVALADLPLTPNGKVDRGALARLEPAADGREPAAGQPAPLAPTAELLAGIWAEVLGLERVAGDASFFDLGGHSLLASRVIARVRQVFAVELPLRAVFEEASLAGLAARIEGERRAPAAVLPPILPVSRDGALALSFSQERLWFLDQLDPGSPVYNVPFALALAGTLDVPALAAALAGIVRRHQVLRTTFARDAASGRPVQRIAAAASPGLAVADLSSLPAAARAAEAERRAAAEARRPFDLAVGPPCRFSLLRLGDGEHRLLVNLHHIVSDGWSIDVFLREMAALYRAAPLPELPVQYADYAAWQRCWLAAPAVMAAQLGYWRERLAGAPGALDLPVDRPRPAVQSLAGERVAAGLPESLSRQLRLLARRQGATLFMVLLAGFEALLARLSGQQDVVVGSPVANRGRSEIEGLIGCFVNTLALRGGLAGDPGFGALLARVRESSLDAWAHQDLPFERLVEELRPERDLSRPPLFQVMLNYQGAAAALPTLPGLAVHALPMASGTSKFELTLGLAEAGAGIEAALEYAAALFDAATARRLLARYGTLLAGAAAEPERSLRDLPWLAAAERQQVLREWNDTDPAAATACLHQLFAAQAKRAPGATALVFGTQRLTYAELDARASRQARHLAWLGVGPEVAVGLCVERSTEMVVGMLGVLGAGGAYVPLDPEYPAQRLAWILEDLADGRQPPLVLTQRDLLPRFAGIAARTVCLDEGWDEAAETGPRPVGLGNLAYVIYTSGSTGRPKGIAIEHRTAAALVPWSQRVFSDREMAGVLAATSINFDLSVFELLVTLARGGKVILAANVLALPALPAAAEVTLIDTVPSAVEELVRSGGIPASVLTVNLAGEPLTRALVDGIYAAGTVERVLNLYGPSEDTTFSTLVAVRRKERRAPTIGRPLAGTRAQVLDRRLEPVPLGVPGELFLGGAGLSRGYLRRPELTAERYLPDPFGPPGARLYRTGDLARYLHDGQLEYLGRMDHQVKVRGFRIELGEVEAALAAHPALAQVVVVAREDRPGDRRLAAYAVPAAGAAPPAAAELRGFLRRFLPEFMVPSDFVLLAELPLTPNGKLDRAALPAPDAARRRPAGGVAAPRTPEEELLAGIWSELLGIESPGIEDDFFDLGGHSLLATRVAARVRAAFGVELPLRSLFAAPTIAGLAASIAALRLPAGGAPDVRPILPVPRTGDLPLSFAQERLWFLDQLEPGTGTFNIPAAVRLRGRFRREVFARSVTEIVHRHEALRTTFGMAGERPVQVIAPPGPVAAPLIDLSPVPREARRRAADRLAADEAARPFDLARGPLLRSVLLRLGREEHVALVTVHHIVSDGWSTGVLLRELAALYPAFAAHAASPLPELAVQYADYSAWQRAWLRGAVLERQIGYWRKRLAGASRGLDLPADRPRRAVPTGRSGRLSLRLSGELSSGLRAVSRREGATLFMALLAAFELLLCRHSGQDDLTLGVPIAGRGRAEVEGLIGCFLNTLVLRTDLSGNPAFRDLLGRVRETALGAYAHQDVPFEKLLEELQPERDLSRTPFFQVMFNMLNLPRVDAELPDLALEVVSPPAAGSKFDLTLYVADRADGIGIEWVYDADLFDPARIALLARQLESLLAQAVERPGSPVDDFSLLTAADRAALPDPAAPLRREWHGAVHEHFGRAARRAPERSAILAGDRVWTYGELDAAGDGLAHHLREQGIGTGDVVAVYAQRGAGLVLALVGALKAGAAFLVLDSAYPGPRLACCVTQARPRALLALEAAGPLPAELEAAFAPIGTIGTIGTIGGSGGSACGSGATAPLCRVGVPEDWRTARWAAAPAGFAPPPAGPDDLAYLAFTSGSTGVPKGILGSHGPLSHFLAWHIGASELAATDRFSLLSGLAHDPLLRDVFTPLCLGAALCIPPAAETPEPAALVRWLAASGVTVAHLTPAMAQLVDSAGAAGAAGTLPLRRVFFGGGVLDGRDVARLRRLAPGCIAVNFYGTTETPQAMGFQVVDRDTTAGAVPLGRGIDGVQLLVLGRSGGLAAPGERGEIHVRTPYLAQGYLGDPGLTAERFLVNPWTGAAADRLYRTGDLGRYRLDGTVEIAGRTDDQVNVRGFRVEPGEVEAALRRHPAVLAAAVTAVAGPDGARLAAYVVADGELPSADLRQFLRQALPEAMVPTVFVSLEALPLTPNGKVDRRALPAPAAAGGERQAYVAPRTVSEELLAGIWAEVLRIERVGAHDNFFDLGGHSLLASQVVSRVRAAAELELPLRTLFRNPTVEGLAGALEDLLLAQEEAAGSA